VFGFVYSGLDIGGALAPIIIGRLLDHGHARGALWMGAALLIFAILTIFAVRRRPPVAVLKPAE
jgi:predicted MFS family arabinose efflux permease